MPAERHYKASMVRYRLGHAARILGVSVEPPQATWGTMIAIGKGELEQAPFILWIPIAGVFLTAVSLNYLGDVIRDRFDVRESAL